MEFITGILKKTQEFTGRNSLQKILLFLSLQPLSEKGSNERMIQ
jgi:hypothetical protein